MVKRYDLYLLLDLIGMNNYTAKRGTALEPLGIYKKSVGCYMGAYGILTPQAKACDAVAKPPRAKSNGWRSPLYANSKWNFEPASFDKCLGT